MHTKIAKGWLNCSKCGHSLGRNISVAKINKISKCRYCKSLYEIKTANDSLSNSGEEIFSVSITANPVHLVAVPVEDNKN
jgi:hypothetical protein